MVTRGSRISRLLPWTLSLDLPSSGADCRCAWRTSYQWFLDHCTHQWFRLQSLSCYAVRWGRSNQLPMPAMFSTLLHGSATTVFVFIQLLIRRFPWRQSFFLPKNRNLKRTAWRNGLPLNCELREKTGSWRFHDQSLFLRLFFGKYPKIFGCWIGYFCSCALIYKS